MTVLVFVKPVDVGGVLTTDVHVMDVMEEVIDHQLFLDAPRAKFSMWGYYGLDQADADDVSVYKWMHDQATAGAVLKTSAYTERHLATYGYILPPVPVPPPMSAPAYSSPWIQRPAAIDTFADILNSEPACFCPSPSEHQEHCQYIKWRRAQKR